MEEQVDILLTTYNTNPRFLREQIDSILKQTYKNIKLIISDDCSSNENVREILEHYEGEDNRIELYFQEKNIGCTKGFEFLLSKSTGDFVAFADHDDIWYENKIEESMKALKTHNVSLVYCDAKQIDEEGLMVQPSYLRYKNMPILNGEFKEILPFSRHIAIGCSQLFTKEVRDLMLPFTPNTLVHDWHSLYIASKLKGVYCIDKPLFGYRIHSSNVFGGRSFKQNMKLWKEKNGSNYKSYLKYRHYVITQTYLSGAKMCMDYITKLKDNNIQDEKSVIKYYEKAQNTKIIYFQIHKYFRFLYFKGMKKRKYKEILILHFPLLSYLVFKIA